MLVDEAPEVVQVTGRAVYARTSEDGRREVGIEFLDVSRDDRQLIEEVLAELA